MSKITEVELIIQLESIKNNHYQPKTNEELESITFQIIENIGSPNPYLRDQLGYSILSQWIYKQKLLSHEQLREVLEKILSNDMIFDGINTEESDKVFKRSFSVLILALNMLRDNDEAFLTENEVKRIMENAVRYCQLEKDFRGYVEGRGWAHAAAHVSDLIDECVKNRYVDEDSCTFLWTGIRSLIHNANVVFQAEEDERIAIPLISMIETKKISLNTMSNWFLEEKIVSESAFDNMKMVRRTNWKHVVRSLYFQLLRKNLDCIHERTLFEVEDVFNIFK